MSCQDSTKSASPPNLCLLDELNSQRNTPMALIRQSVPRLGSITPRCTSTQQCRHASLLRRPKRPYTFTQLITLSDGSSFVHRTTSPASVYKSNKDARNNPLWNPSLTKLLNVEEDEAGRLRKFRARFGRGWDAEAVAEDEQVGSGSLILHTFQLFPVVPSLEHKCTSAEQNVVTFIC